MARNSKIHRACLFEQPDGQVRVVDVRIQPGQKVAMHSHPANVVYFVTDAKFKLTFPDGKTALREIKAGTALWSGPVTHAVENQVLPTTILCRSK